MTFHVGGSRLDSSLGLPETKANQAILGAS